MVKRVSREVQVLVNSAIFLFIPGVFGRLFGTPSTSKSEFSPEVFSFFLFWTGVFADFVIKVLLFTEKSLFLKKGGDFLKLGLDFLLLSF